MKLSNLQNREIIETDGATTVGTVEGVVVDADQRSATALLVDAPQQGTVLIDWAEASHGSDVVTISSGKHARGPGSDLERRVVEHGLTVIGKRILTDVGEEVGIVHDVIVDSSGSIEHFDLGPESETQLAGSALIGLGDHALIVSKGTGT